MITRRHRIKPLRALTAAAVLGLTAICAGAGTWSVTWAASGTNTLGNTTTAWATPPAGNTALFYQLQWPCEDVCTPLICQGSAHPVLHWTPDPMLAYDPLPKKVNYLFTVWCGATEDDVSPFTVVYDSLNDPTFSYCADWCETRLVASHPYSIDTNGSDDVAGPGIGVNVLSNTNLVYASFTIDVVDINLHCESTDGVVNPDGSVPFFSGTNCLARGTIMLPALAGGVAEATLKVGGEPVDWYPAGVPGEEPPVPPRDWTPSARFDSTHFPSGEPVPVILTATDTNGHKWETSITAHAYNKALALGGCRIGFGSPLYVGEHCAQAAADALSFVNYQSPVTPHTHWHQSTIIDAIPGASAFYIANHGDSNPGCFMACDWTDDEKDLNYLLDQWILCSQIGTAVELKRASGVWSAPPYNLVVIAGCSTLEKVEGSGRNAHVIPGGIDDRIAGNEGFGLLVDAQFGTSQAVDRAYIGFNTDQTIINLLPYTLSLFTELVNGGTALEAVIFAYDYVNEDAGGFSLDMAKVLDDTDTRLHGVYGGYDRNWHRRSP